MSEVSAPSSGARRLRKVKVKPPKAAIRPVQAEPAATYSPQVRAQISDAQVRPDIWVSGKQSPSFEPMLYAEAGMLLARDSAAEALMVLSTEASALSARLEVQDWSAITRRLGRLGPLVPSPFRLAQGFESAAWYAQGAQRVLYGLPTRAPEPPPSWLNPDILRPRPPAEPLLNDADLDLVLRRAVTAPAPAEQETYDDLALMATDPKTVNRPAPVPEPQAATPVEDDPDLVAIRALLKEEPKAEPKRPAPRPPVERAAFRPLPPADEPVAPAQAPGASARAPLVVIDLPLPHWLTEGARWTALRVLAGTVLFFATPVGYGRALWRHLEGHALADVIADCRRNAQQ